MVVISGKDDDDDVLSKRIGLYLIVNFWYQSPALLILILVSFL